MTGNHRFRRTIALVLSCSMLAACATPAFRETGSLVAIEPSDVQQSGDRHVGSEVIWGGRIIAVENREDATEVEVIGYPMDRDQQPMPDAPTVGRFIVVLPGFVEPLDYPVGRHLSVVGIVSGTRLGHVDEHAYLYPLLRAREVKVWPWGFMFDKRPRVSIGVGVRIH
ncbi:MAG: Slp family lipoprotein [Xanthomonadales bacterium]|nr:Slp family lipoprotein [Xanthomonadales bacterium]